MFSNEERKVKVKPFSRVRLFATPWTVVYQAPPFMGFSSGIFQARILGVGCHFLLQEIFPTQGLNTLVSRIVGGRFTG